MSEDKENYYKVIEGNTVIESWQVDHSSTLNRHTYRGIHYKMRVTINGVPQRIRSYTNKDTFLSLRMSEYMQAQKRSRVGK